MSGPLDEIFAAFRRPGDALPLEPVHARVLEQDAGDHHAWVLAVWQDPGEPQALHAALRPRIEATLLAELSRAAADLGARPRRFDALRLAVFPALASGHVEPAVRAFGLREADPDTPAWRQALAHLRNEAQQVGADVGDAPTSVWEAPVAHHEPAERIERTLLERTPAEPWGATPGAFFHRLAAAMGERGLAQPTADLDGLRIVEAALVRREPGPVRWLPPLVFQGLCDLVAVAGAASSGREVQWAVCEPAEEGDLSPPPLVRVAADGGWAHVPLGLELLRWCVMPVRPGEELPSVADWVRDAFR